MGASKVVAPLRVLLVDNSFTFGGAILSLSQLVARLPEQGVEPVVMSGQSPDVMARLFPGVKWHSIQLPLPWVHGDPLVGDPPTRRPDELGPLLRTARSVYWAFRGELGHARIIRRLARRHGARLIHLNNTAESQSGGALAARWLGVPCVSHMREALVRTYPSSRVRMALPHRHIAISTAVRDSMVAAGVPAERIAIVHNAVDLAGFSPGAPPAGLAESLGIRPEDRVIGMFGRIVPFKGILEFLRAFALVAAAVPEATFLVVGDRSDGPVEYERQVHQLVGDLGLRDRVVFAGFRTDVADLLRLCHAVVLSSLGEEGFGRTLVEAMATGLPVVAPPYGGPLDIVRDGVDGFLRDPRDTEGFAEACVRLLGHEVDRQRLGANARARAVDEFSDLAHAARVAALYRALLSW